MALSDAQFTAWLASASSIRTVLVEVVSRIAGSETTLYLSSRNYITAAADTPASTAYQACIAGGVSTRESLNLDGSPSMSWGDIEIGNADGSRDAWLDYVWANRAVNVYVGDPTWPRADFRLVSATHRNLDAMVRNETFRRDLYFRINTFPVRMPSLSARPEDLPLLAESLLARVAPQRRLRLTPAALKELSAMRFEGNIRELRNLLERASLLADGAEIEPRHLVNVDDTPRTDPSPTPAPQWRTLDENERDYLAWALKHHQGDRASLARRLGLSQRTLFRKLRQLGQ